MQYVWRNGRTVWVNWPSSPARAPSWPRSDAENHRCRQDEEIDRSTCSQFDRISATPHCPFPDSIVGQRRSGVNPRNISFPTVQPAEIVHFIALEDDSRSATTQLTSLPLSERGLLQSTDITHTVRPAEVAMAGHGGHMISDEVPAEVHVDERLHQFVHVGIPVVDVRLDEVRDRRRHVAEVDLPQLAHLRETAHRFVDILTGALAAFHPGSTAQAHAYGGRVRNLQRLDVAVVGAEDVARDSGEFGNRRIVRVNADTNAGFLRHRGNLTDEVRIVIPEFFL